MIKKDLELIFELGCLRFIQRSWKQFLGPDFANLAEHHLRVAWLSMLLAKMEKRGDTGKIVKMAMVHDVAESRTGDVHYISRQYTKRNEHLAIKDIFKDTALDREMVNLWEEYEKRQSIESKIVKDADFLDVDFEIKERKAAGANFLNVWADNRKTIYKLFYTDSARKLWKELNKANLTDWFKNARNRYTEGDLKKMADGLKKQAKKSKK